VWGEARGNKTPLRIHRREEGGNQSQPPLGNLQTTITGRGKIGTSVAVSRRRVLKDVITDRTGKRGDGEMKT